MRRRLSKPSVLILLLAISFFFGQLRNEAWADELVSCRYQQAEGKRISLRLDIGSPPPTMLILVQRLPKGTTINKATPPIKKYNPNQGEAKWLLKRLKSGSMLFTIDLDHEVTAAQVSGEIRYKNPAGGKMKVIAINP